MTREKRMLYLILSGLLHICNGYLQVTPSMKTFSAAIKNGQATANVEQTLFETYEGMGVITHQWCGGGKL